MSRRHALNLLDRNLVFENDQKHLPEKLTEGVALTSSGRDGLPFDRRLPGVAWLKNPGRAGARPCRDRYQEINPPPLGIPVLKLSGASLICCRSANNSCLALSYWPLKASFEVYPFGCARSQTSARSIARVKEAES